MCQCVDISMGSYANQIALEYPFPTERFPNGGKIIGIDQCISEEIQYLWRLGIETIESCCGHNEITGYIAVKPEYIPQMKSMGYVNNNKSRPEIFKAMS